MSGNLALRTLVILSELAPRQSDSLGSLPHFPDSASFRVTKANLEIRALDDLEPQTFALFQKILDHFDVIEENAGLDLIEALYDFNVAFPHAVQNPGCMHWLEQACSKQPSESAQIASYFKAMTKHLDPHLSAYSMREAYHQLHLFLSTLLGENQIFPHLPHFEIDGSHGEIVENLKCATKLAHRINGLGVNATNGFLEALGEAGYLFSANVSRSIEHMINQDPRSASHFLDCVLPCVANNWNTTWFQTKRISAHDINEIISQTNKLTSALGWPVLINEQHVLEHDSNMRSILKHADKVVDRYYYYRGLRSVPHGNSIGSYIIRRALENQ